VHAKVDDFGMTAITKKHKKEIEKSENPSELISVPHLY